MSRHNLSFDQLRQANTARLPQFKNSKGGAAHSMPDGSDWSLGEWANAVLGELGEAANIIKKVRRGDMTMDQARPHLAKELADVVTYLDILAMRSGVDLGDATVDKFNEVSIRVGSDVFISIPQHQCRFCGSPTWVDPSDQVAPNTTCSESNHGHGWLDDIESQERQK